MRKVLLFDSINQNKYRMIVFFLIFFFFQKSAATTFYINDNNSKGDIYTTALGNDSNDGITSASPKLSIRKTYEKAQDDDIIIIDTGIYPDLSDKGVLSFNITKKIKFIIAGFSDGLYSRTPLPVNQKVSPEEFYIVNDKPIDRDAYIHRPRNGVITKPQ